MVPILLNAHPWFRADRFSSATSAGRFRQQSYRPLGDVALECWATSSRNGERRFTRNCKVFAG